MPVVKPTILENNLNGLSAVWENVTENDTFGALTISDGYADMSIAIDGTFNGATITIEGSLGGNHRDAMVDANGVIMQYSAVTNIIPVGPAVAAVHPTISGGSSTGISVYLYYAKRRG